MSRFEGDGEAFTENQQALWDANVDRALKGKRGQQALRDLKAALLALPEPKLIERALCTRGGERIPDLRPEDPTDRFHFENWIRDDMLDLIHEQGQGVCAVGAYVWYQKVKGGMDPEAAFASLPTYADFDSSPFDTTDAGEKAGLTSVLAWELATLNDVWLEGATGEDRYAMVMEWIDERLIDATA